MSVRMQKVNQELRRQITDIIQKDIDDPVTDFLSITKVETTADLQESKVYYSLLNEKDYHKVQQVLESMRGLIRARLAKKIKLKFLPQLTFIADKSIKYSVEIYQKIEEIKGTDKRKTKKNK